MKIVNSLEDLTDYLKKELDLKPGNIINIASSPIQREYELEIKWQPKTKEEFDAVKQMPEDILKKMGVCKFKEGTTRTLFLYPGEWFNNIPEGYPVVNIFWTSKLFCKETADDDIRYGCLPYGFVRSRTCE